MRNCTLTESQLFQDILSYCLPLIGCTDSSSTSDISNATGNRLASRDVSGRSAQSSRSWALTLLFTEKYIKKLFGANKDRMGTDQKAVLLVSKVNERLKHSECAYLMWRLCLKALVCSVTDGWWFLSVPPFTTCKSQRKWRPEAQRVKTAGQDDEDHTSVDVTVPVRHGQSRLMPYDHMTTVIQDWCECVMSNPLWQMGACRSAGRGPMSAWRRMTSGTSTARRMTSVTWRPACWRVPTTCSFGSNWPSNTSIRRTRECWRFTLGNYIVNNIVSQYIYIDI